MGAAQTAQKRQRLTQARLLTAVTGEDGRGIGNHIVHVRDVGQQRSDLGQHQGVDARVRVPLPQGVEGGQAHRHVADVVQADEQQPAQGLRGRQAGGVPGRGRQTGRDAQPGHGDAGGGPQQGVGGDAAGGAADDPEALGAGGGKSWPAASRKNLRPGPSNEAKICFG